MTGALRAVRGLAGALGAAGVLYLWGAKRGLVIPSPTLMALLGSGLLLAGAAWCALVLVRLARGPRRVSAAAQVAAAAGLLALAAGGLANWAFGQQGFVILFEREPVRLSRPGAISAFSRGPLADPRDLDLTVALARLRFEKLGPSAFRAVSALKVLPAGGDEVGLLVKRDAPARLGPTVFRQGAFGFAPRIAVAVDGKIVHEQHVPFRTLRPGREEISFLGELELPGQRLKLTGAVLLQSLEEDVKGHPHLEFQVEREGRDLGAGRIKLGEAKDVGEGIRVGFIGLQHWSEIDLSRRTYPVPILSGAAFLVLGLLGWALAAWRGV